ncbi:MAG: peptidase M13 [Acidobacteria bacterium]|nr:peptidase M13 [Acidobacteriota bacterium]
MTRPIGVLWLLGLLAACSGSVPAPAEEYVTNERGLDRRNMDLSVDACQDFYLYANGTWLTRNPIPPEYSSWGVSSELRQRNYATLREILEQSAASSAEMGTNEQKVGDFWASGMDTATIEADGATALSADFARLDRVENLQDLQTLLNELQAKGTAVLFDLGVDQDLRNSEQYILYAVQGGLGLPDRDYYTREDEESVDLRDEYVAHISKMLQLVGDSPQDADATATAILDLETRLANASLTNVELRDPSNYYNIQSVADADSATPNFSWTSFLDQLGLGHLETFSYAHPKFFDEMNAMLEQVTLDTWKDYVRWHLTTSYAPYLSDAFVDEDFAFFAKTLRGTEEILPRWKRVVDRTSASMGEALGEVYVARAFPPATKARAATMIEGLRAAVRSRLQDLDWMGETTKARALEKLESFVFKIGYPDNWRDYSRLNVGRDSYLANVRAARAFEVRRNTDKIGQPIDRSEWEMSPQTVNAYYNPLMNEIVFPAAIMQPPFFDGEMDDAVNYGAMGAIIGHEFMHGFDDQGSRFDPEGNMANWWTDEDRAQFDERTAKLVTQYGGFVAIDDLHVNGELTLGENIGDLAGTTMAYYALQNALRNADPGNVDGFTPNQRFFLSWAQSWRRNQRPEDTRLQVNIDPHSPSRFRTNGPLANMPEFASAFGCQAGDPMVQSSDDRADIW